jgi:hypothetical protein
MKVAVFSTKLYDRQFLEASNHQHELVFFEPQLNQDIAETTLANTTSVEKHQLCPNEIHAPEKIDTRATA